MIDFGKISIVDDDDSILRATKALLRSVGYDVETFASAELFLVSDALRRTECLVLDVRMPGMNGLELQRQLNDARLRLPIIFISAHDDKSARRTAMASGAATVFRKPFDANVFLAAIEAALRSGSFDSSSRPRKLALIRREIAAFERSSLATRIANPQKLKVLLP